MHTRTITQVHAHIHTYINTYTQIIHFFNCYHFFKKNIHMKVNNYNPSSELGETKTTGSLPQGEQQIGAESHILTSFCHIHHYSLLCPLQSWMLIVMYSHVEFFLSKSLFCSFFDWISVVITVYSHNLGILPRYFKLSQICSTDHSRVISFKWHSILKFLSKRALSR